MWRAILLSSLAARLGVVPLLAAADAVPIEPVELDDECAADAPCALQATQLRVHKSDTKASEATKEVVGNTDNMSVRQLANDSLDSLEMASESEEVHLGSIADGPGASYTAEELLALMALSRKARDQRANETADWGSSGHSNPISFTSQCYSFTGGTCAHASCDYSRLSQCNAGRCVCPGGCAGADGRCYPSGNMLVASGFTLKNVKWPKYRMYFKRVSAWNQMGTSSMPSFSFMGSDRFDLYRIPGLYKERALYFLASHKWPEYVLAIRATVGTAFSPFGTYTVKLKDESAPWKPEDIFLRVCSMASYGKPNEIMFGSAGSVKTIWGYVHSGDWDVWGAMTSPGTGGKWYADPPIPAGTLSPC